MSGFSRKCMHSAAHPHRVEMVLGLAVLAIAGSAIIDAAQAQGCLGGYRMLKDQIPVCVDEPVGAIAPYAAAPLASYPLYTGAIGSAAVAEEAPYLWENTDSVCSDGMRFWATPNNGWTVMLECDWEGMYGRR
jgi:hypothetical protein